MLVTLARSKATSSDNARLVPWTTLSSMERRSPPALMISPQSCATVNLRAHALPMRRPEGIDIDDLKSRVAPPASADRDRSRHRNRQGYTLGRGSG
jgi:hypothetical protein